MQRVTISIDETLAANFDQLVDARGYQSRSEGVRDLVREAVEAWRAEQTGEAHCVASLSYVYDRSVRMLAQRLSELMHEAHDLVVAATQMPLDHDHTLESVLLRGAAASVRAFADRLKAERGVRFGALNLITVDPNNAHHESTSHHHASPTHLAPSPG